MPKNICWFNSYPGSPTKPGDGLAEQALCRDHRRRKTPVGRLRLLPSNLFTTGSAFIISHSHQGWKEGTQQTRKGSWKKNFSQWSPFYCKLGAIKCFCAMRRFSAFFPALTQHIPVSNTDSPMRQYLREGEVVGESKPLLPTLQESDPSRVGTCMVWQSPRRTDLYKEKPEKAFIFEN